MKKVIKAGFASATCLIGGHVFAQSQELATYGWQNALPSYAQNARGGQGGITLRIDDLRAPHSFSRALANPLWPADRRGSDFLGATRDEVSVGYGWRNVRLEGALTTENESQDNWLRLGSSKSSFTSSRRLSLSSHKNWTFQVSRGRMNRADQYDPNEEVKRTTISTVYQYPFDHARWETTLAYGRSGKKEDGSVGHAYLFESMLKMRSAHMVFARAERAAADELFRDREALHGQNFNTNRYTLGYVYNVPSTGPAKLTVGSLISKRVVPPDRVASVGQEPVGYKVFVRLSVQMR